MIKERQGKPLKCFQLDGTTTVLFRKWEALLHRNFDGGTNSFMIQQLGIILPMLYAKEKGINFRGSQGLI